MNMSLLCIHCGSNNFVKNGSYQGVQRYKCKLCKRYFSSKPRKFTYQDKAKAIEMYRNKVGIRKIARFIQCSPALIIRWIKAFSKPIACQLEQGAKQVKTQVPDLIEMDEIDTFVKKNVKEQSIGLVILGSKVVLLPM